MATYRNYGERETLSLPYEGEDLYRRLSDGAMRGQIPYRRARKRTLLERELVHRPKNGIYDPITYYHILEVLLRARQGEEFRTGTFVNTLTSVKKQLVWDVTTVGRVIADMAESLADANDFTPIVITKRWNGMTYMVSDHPHTRIVMFRLLEDLIHLSEETIARELTGEVIKRTESPLEHCPSVVV